MTLDHRKATIAAELLQQNCTNLIASLALAHQQLDELKAENAALKKAQSPQPEPAAVLPPA